MDEARQFRGLARMSGRSEGHGLLGGPYRLVQHGRVVGAVVQMPQGDGEVAQVVAPPGVFGRAERDRLAACRHRFPQVVRLPGVLEQHSEGGAQVGQPAGAFGAVRRGGVECPAQQGDRLVQRLPAPGALVRIDQTHRPSPEFGRALRARRGLRCGRGLRQVAGEHGAYFFGDALRICPEHGGQEPDDGVQIARDPRVAQGQEA